MQYRRIPFLALAIYIALGAVSFRAQSQVPIRFTPALEYQVRQSIRLTGSVESRQTAVVATEVAGVVAQHLTPEGTQVRQGSPLIRLRREPIELRQQAAKGQLAEAEARLKSAELKLERNRELRDSEVVSRQLVDDAAYDAEAWQGRVAQLRAEVARLERDLGNTTVRAAFDGVVGREHCQVGEWLDIGDPVVDLISLDSLEVRLEVPERRFDALVPGASAKVGFEALPGFGVDGTIRAIVPRADLRSRTFPVLIELPNRDHRVGVGMLAQVDLAIGEPTRATLVPKDAVVTRDRQTILFVLNGDETVRRVVVETGTGVGQWVVVHGNLEPGDRIATRGNETLADGQAVSGTVQSYPPPDAVSGTGP